MAGEGRRQGREEREEWRQGRHEETLEISGENEGGWEGSAQAGSCVSQSNFFLVMFPPTSQIVIPGFQSPGHWDLERVLERVPPFSPPHEATQSLNTCCPSPFCGRCPSRFLSLQA